MADDKKVSFNWYLNRQGPRGPQGVKGDTGFSPSISVETDNLNEYILRITNEGSYFLTPNLREHKEDRGGTYIRYDRESGVMYAGSADVASEDQEGIIRIANADDIEAEDEFTAVTPAILADYIGEKGGASIDDNDVSTSKVWSSEKTSTSIATVSNQVASNTEDITNIKTALPNKQNKLTAGSNITISGDTISAKDTTYTAGKNITIENGVISSTGGEGDVTLAGDNSFTGNNSFDGETTFNGHIWAVEQEAVTLNVTSNATLKNAYVTGTISSLGELTAVFINAAGIKNNQNNKYYLNQASITAGDNITVEETTDGVKISSTASGNTIDTINSAYQMNYGVISSGVPITFDGNNITINSGTKALTPNGEINLTNNISYTYDFNTDRTIFLQEDSNGAIDYYNVLNVFYNGIQPEPNSEGQIAWFDGTVWRLIAANGTITTLATEKFTPIAKVYLNSDKSIKLIDYNPYYKIIDTSLQATIDALQTKIKALEDLIDGGNA